MRDAAHQLGEHRDVVDVLQAFPHGLQHDREVRVLARDVQQLGGPLPLMPQRRPLAGVTPRQQQRPCRTLAEAGGEQRRPADLGRDDGLDLVGVEHENVCAGWGFPGVGQPQHDAVVGCGGLLVDAVPLHDPAADGQCQWPVYPQSVGGMQDDPPIAELVAEPFHHEGGVGRYGAGGLSLLVQQLPQIVGGVAVETHCAAVLVELGAGETGEFPGEGTDSGTQLGGTADGVAAPERQPRGLARCGQDQYPIVGDLGDPPAGGAQGDDVAGARLVDHLFIEFAYPRGLFVTGCQIDGEHAAVRDRAAGGDGQSLRAGTSGQGAGVAVVDQPRPQLRELGGRVLAGQQIQCRFEGAARQRGERRAAADGVEPPVGVERLERGCRDGVLGQHVEGIGGYLQGFDLAGAHPLHGDRAVDQVDAVLGQQHALGDLADLVTGAADALQAAGYRRWRFDLDDQIDRTHVDAEFEARGGHHGFEPAALEIVFDLGAGLLADRSVVSLGQQTRCAEGLAAGHDGGGRAATDLRVAFVGQLDAGAGGVNLVEPRGEPFGQPPGIGEHQG